MFLQRECLLYLFLPSLPYEKKFIIQQTLHLHRPALP